MCDDNNVITVNTKYAFVVFVCPRFSGNTQDATVAKNRVVFVFVFQHSARQSSETPPADNSFLSLATQAVEGRVSPHVRQRKGFPQQSPSSIPSPRSKVSPRRSGLNLSTKYGNKIFIHVYTYK